jgi:cell shape-determining protein MreC
LKKGGKVALTLVVISSSVFSTTFASADTRVTPPSSSSPSDSNSAYKAAMEKFRLDQKNFIDALKSYDAARRAINKTFKESVEKALTEAKSLAAPGQTQLQKRLTSAAKQSAVIAATAVRDAAIEALGPAPVPPTPPAKAPRMEKGKKVQPSASPNSLTD